MPDTIPPPAPEATPSDIEVTFEKWAQASAKLLRRSIVERAQVLSQSGIVGSWKEVDEHWYETLIQDIDSGRLERLNRYMRICEEEMAERARNEDEVASPLDAIGGPLDPPSQEEQAASVGPGSTIPEQDVIEKKPLASVTPPLGSASDSIEIDLTDMEIPSADDESDEISPDDTRVSATITELEESGH